MDKVLTKEFLEGLVEKIMAHTELVHCTPEELETTYKDYQKY